MTQIQLRRGTASAWTTANTVLAQGEVGLETDTGNQKSGDGTTAWNALPYISGPNGANTNGANKLLNIGDLGMCNAYTTEATSTVGTSRMAFTVGPAATNIAALFGHSYTQQSSFPYTDALPSGPISFNASLEVVSSSNPNTIAGTIYRLTFGGRTTATLDPGGRIVSDLLGMSLNSGDVVAVRTYLASGTAYGFRSVNGVAGGRIGGFTAASDLTAPGSGAVTGSIGLYYGPSALLGYPDSPATAKSVIAIGDSIGWGAADNGVAQTQGTLYPGGFLVRALSGVAGLFNLSLPSDQATWFQTSNGSSFRLANVNRANSVILEHGTNDLSGGQANVSAATLQATMLDLASKVRRLGISKVFILTVVPRTTSTDNWATTANQTPAATDSQRILYNTWIRARCPIDPTTKSAVAGGTAGALLAGSFGHPITGFFDVAATVESSLNSGVWAPAKRVATGSMTASSTTLTSTDAAFVSSNHEVGGDLGEYVYLAGAGAAGAALGTTLTTISSSTQASTAPAASTTVTNAALVISPATVNGIHPSSHSCYLMAQAINTALL